MAQETLALHLGFVLTQTVRGGQQTKAPESKFQIPKKSKAEAPSQRRHWAKGGSSAGRRRSAGFTQRVVVLHCGVASSELCGVESTRRQNRGVADEASATTPGAGALLQN